MSDLHGLNTPAKLPVFSTVRTAWQQVRGFKALAWGGTGFYILIAIGITVVAGLIFGLLLAAFNLPAEANNASPTELNPAFITSEALRVFFNLVVSFLTAPLIVGQVMLAVRHFRRTPATTVYDLFNYYKWHYLWRFFAVSLILYGLIFLGIFAGCLLYYAAMLIPQHIPALMFIFKGLFIIGAILFVFLIFYLVISMQFSQLLIADKNFHVRKSVSCSFRTVAKNFWRVLGVLVVCALILLPFELVFVGVFVGFGALDLHWVGALIDVIGLIALAIWLLPWALLVNGIMYEYLFGHKNP